MPTNSDMRKLRISSSQNLDQAMTNIRRFLTAQDSAVGLSGLDSRTVSNSTAARSLTAQAAMISKLSEIAARLGQLERGSELGTVGIFLKRVVRKAIGWYSRPVYDFDRTMIVSLEQIRRDMLGLQEQLFALQQAIAKEATASLIGSQSSGEFSKQRNPSTE
jgi:hypothetical protein